MNNQQRFQEMVNSFSVSKFEDWCDPFDPHALAENFARFSTSEQNAIAFLFEVWSGGNHGYDVPAFNVVESMLSWDGRNRAAFMSWVISPFIA